MAYEHMASVYDQLMNDAPYDEWLAFTKGIFTTYGENPKTVADLGCGTGEITIGLAEAGYESYGIDFSADMLAYAEQKVHTDHLPIHWIQQDLRTLNGFKNLDAAVSFCDVMNYIITESDLRATFKNIYHSLKPSGLFMFDIHSMDYVENRMKNNTFTEILDEVAYIWDCIPGEQVGEMYHEMTFFTVNEQGTYDRMDESHHQRTYSISFYEKLLIETGFEKPVLYSDFSLEKEKFDEKSERIFFVTKKRSR